MLFLCKNVIFLHSTKKYCADFQLIKKYFHFVFCHVKNVFHLRSR